MGFLESLFAGVKVFVKEVVTIVSEAIRVVLEEIDRSQIGKAATELVRGMTRRYFKQAEDLAWEERELAEKFARDGKWAPADQDRLLEIEAERDQLRKELDAAKAKEAAEEFKNESEEVISAEMTDDELSAAVGILAYKECPECGGMMRIRQGALNVTSDRRNFYWQCTAPNALLCPSITLQPSEFKASVLRKEDADLDGDRKKRQQIWGREDVLNKTHSRLRQNHLDESDEEVICPHHLLPMKLVQKRAADGRMLSSYEYVCMGIQPNGRACAYIVGLETFPQVASMLQRREGRGIIDG